MNFLDGIAISNYRSFGPDLQKIGPFSKINIFIGKNNSGKSNILRFVNFNYIKTIHYVSGKNNFLMNYEDTHLGLSKTNLRYGLGINLNEESTNLECHNFIENKSIPSQYKDQLIKIIQSFKEVSEGMIWTILESEQPKRVLEFPPNVLTKIRQKGVRNFKDLLTALNLTLVNEQKEQLFDILRLLVLHCTIKTDTSLISDFRKINRPIENSEGNDPHDDKKEINNKYFDGSDLIKNLAKLESPPYQEYQEQRFRFEAIQKFVQKVTGSNNAKLTIPHSQDMILVDIDGNNNFLPIESLGSGIHELIILSAACTILDNQIVCIEEPELHLHPLLQKEFITYIIKNTNNQYFISSHSAHLLNTSGVSIFHVTLENGVTKVSNAYKISEKYSICQDLGYQPSDLFQTNSIIWVEGPSDRIYLNYWIHGKDSNLIEGLHYSIMFYGGRLLSNLTSENDPVISDFISLRKINQNTSIVIDSDKKNSAYDHINKTKKRIKDEFENQHGLAWVTDGREIENYLDEEVLTQAIMQAHPNSQEIDISGTGRFGCRVRIKNKSGEEVAIDKIKVAKIYTENEGAPDYSILDLDKQIDQIVEFIYKSNNIEKIN